MRRLDGAKFQRLAKHRETQRGHECAHKSKNMERWIREDETKDRQHMKTLSYALGPGCLAAKMEPCVFSCEYHSRVFDRALADDGCIA